MSHERSHSVSLTIISCAHVARDAVLFTMAGLAFEVYYPETGYGSMFLLLFLSDLVAFILLSIPREAWKQLGVVWAGVMTIAVLLSVSQFVFGRGFFGSGSQTILVLSIIELVAISKYGYDILVRQARSWTNDAE